MDALFDRAWSFPAGGRARAAPAAPAQAPALPEGAPAYAHLASLGDKQFLFSRGGDAFLMYAESGSSLVAMGDPVGPEAQAPGLAAQFLDLAARRRRRALFYRAEPRFLAVYAALGLSAQKLGEQAILRLGGAGASLAGPGRANLRHCASRAARAGCRFEIVPAAAVPALLPALSVLSNEWLARKRTREKRFSAGRFDPAYVAQFPLALVRANGAPVAFATLWRAGMAEIEVDLMRSGDGAPYGSMDFLFAGLMRWAAAEGIGALNLGFVPLSGVGASDVPPLWRVPARLAVRHAGAFYNFAGLRRFKSKFAPDWQPRYLAGQGLAASLSLGRAIYDIAALAAGGPAGILLK